MRILAWILVSSAVALPAQDGEGQKNTALLKLYPKLEELVAGADALAKEGKYDAALEIYTEACATFPNHLVPIDGSRAVGVAQFVLDRVSSWPPEGKTAYRRRTDPLAQEDLERARRNRDLDLLDAVVERYPLSSVVDDALVLRASLALDAGDADVAARALERVLASETDLPKPVLAARLGLAYSLAGRRRDLQELIGRAEREWKGGRVRIGEEERPLSAYLRELAEKTRPRPTAAAELVIPAWETIGGDGASTRLAESAVALGSSAWRFQVPFASYETSEEERWRRPPTLSPDEAYCPLFPAVSDGIVYVHDEYAVFALGLFSGGTTLLWSHRVERPGGILMFDDRVIHTTSVADGRVFANLITAHGESEDQLGYVRVKFPFPKRALFALDAYSGKLLWRLGGRPRAESLEEGASFAVAPTPDGDRLYVGAIQQKLSTDPFEHYLLCLDAATGRILWSTFVASGLTEINLFGNSTRESLGMPVAVAGDTLFYGTNHGILAAVEKKTGRLLWTHRYAQLPVLPTRSIYVQRNRLEWVNSPPIVSRDTVLFTPTDSRYLYALEVSTGKRRWQARREEGVRTLYGVKDDLVVAGGEDLYFYDLASGRCLRTFRPRSPGGGRGAVSEDLVYMPTRDGLQTVRLDSKAEADFRRWSFSQQGGNLVVVDGTILRSAPEIVEPFYDRRGFEKEVAEALARDPDNPLIGYRSAVRTAQSGRTAEALTLLEKAYAKVEGSPKPDEERLARACRLRLFTLRFQLGSDALRRRATAEAKDHLTRAVQTAPDVPSRVNSALLLSETFEAIQAPERAIRELYRLLDVGDEVVAGTRVAETVRRRVDETLRRHGSGHFAGLEREAESRLGSARKEGTPEAFLLVARRYPNSVAAERALVEAAEAFQRMGRPDDEIAHLREFLREYPKSKDLAAAHVRLVLALERKGQHGAAAPLLRRMIQSFPDAPVEEGTAREFAEKRLASEAYRKSAAVPAEAALKPPLSLRVTHSERNSTEVVPLRIQGARPSSAADRVFVNYGTAIGAVSYSEPTWSMRLESPLRFARFHEDSLLIGTDRRIVRLNPATGAEEWSYASASALRGFALAGNQVCVFAGDPRNPGASGVAAIDAGRGALSWYRTFEGHSNSPIFACGDLAVFLSTNPSRLLGFEVETGRNVLAAPLASGGLGLQVLQATEQSVLVSATDRFIEAYELPSGRMKWRTDLQEMGARVVEANATSLLILGIRGDLGESPFAAVVDLRTGKYLRMAEGIELGDPRYALLEEDRAFVVSRDGTRREVVVRELSLKDLKVGWTASLGEAGATLLPPEGSPEHVGILTFDRGDNGKFCFSVSLLDKKGRRVQNIRSDFRYERPPNFHVAGGALVVTEEATVQVYK